MASDKSFIPGIYNYCDRWCERCAFTARCRTYERASRYEQGDSEDLSDALQGVHAELEESMALLDAMLQEHEVTITEADLEAAAAAQEEQQQKSREHPLVQLGSAYTEAAGRWLQKPDLTQPFSARLQQQAELGLVSEAQINTAIRQLQEQFDVISYYRIFVPPKIYRAVSGLLAATDEERSDPQSDYRGSAKIAVLGIRNSMAALQQLLPLLPEEEEALIGLLARLQQLERLLLETIPDCMQFKRPGFDEEPA